MFWTAPKVCNLCLIHCNSSVPSQQIGWWENVDKTAYFALSGVARNLNSIVKLFRVVEIHLMFRGRLSQVRPHCWNCTLLSMTYTVERCEWIVEVDCYACCWSYDDGRLHRQRSSEADAQRPFITSLQRVASDEFGIASPYVASSGRPISLRASAHSDRWGQLTPWKNGWKIKQRKHANKSSFLCLCYILRAIRQAGAMLTT